MKAFLANLALVVVSVVLALLLGEGGLRLAGFQPGNPLERLINHPDDFLGYRMVPGMHESVPGPDGVYAVDTVDLGFGDGVGFRDDGIDPPVDSVFIGDSFVWGYGVNLGDAISEQFEALTGRDAVNLGMTSWTSPTQYARLLERYGAPLRPRHVFMEALVENDFGDLANFEAWESSGTAKSYPEWMTDQVMNYSPDSLSYRLRRVAYDHSALGRFVSDRVQFGLSDYDPARDPNLVHVQGEGLDLFLDRRAVPAPGAGPDDRQVAMFRTALLESRRLAERAGARLVVFIVPTKEMVYRENFPEGPLRAGADWRYEALRGLLVETGVEHVDLLPVLEAAAGRGEQLYFAHDTHWTAAGHRLAARALADFVAGAPSGP